MRWFALAKIDVPLRAMRPVSVAPVLQIERLSHNCASAVQFLHFSRFFRGAFMYQDNIGSFVP